MKKIKVLLIAPYEGLKNMVMSILGGDERFDIDVRVGDLEAGVKLVTDLCGNVYDVIISRGGTTGLIEGIAVVPVVDIKLSQYDILHAIRLSQNYSGRTAIVGFPPIIERVEAICGLLGYAMNISVINSAEHVPGCLSKLKDEGYSMIIGDNAAVKTAMEMQMNGILITSGSESILSAFDEAEKICAAVSKVRHENRLYGNMLEGAPFSSLAFGPEGNVCISYKSRSAEDSASQAIESWCAAALEEVRRKNEHFFIRRQGGCLWHINGWRGGGEFSDYSYFSVRRCAEPSGMDKAIEVCSTSQRQPLANSSFYDDSESTRKIIENIRKLGRANLPVVIFGEQGTGKDTAAFEICRQVGGGDKTLITIDCRRLENKHLDYLLHSEKSALLESGIGIYFKRVDALSEKTQLVFSDYIDDSMLHRRNRVVYSCEKDPADAVKDVLISHLTRGSGQECLTLHLPTLRERSGDIPSIASIYINDLNIALGKQVAGLDQESTELLKGFAWSANVTQLKNVLRELVLITDSAFIAGSDTQRVLQKEKRYCGDVKNALPQGTLEDMNLDAIRAVLSEEGMNHSKAAKRLGISRSTLWRKLRG